MLTKFVSALSLILTLSFSTPTQDPAVLINQMDTFYSEITDGYEKNMKINEIDNIIIDTNEIDYSNLKVVCLGDGLTYGSGGSDKKEGGKISYCDYISHVLDCEVLNMGINGTTVGNYYNDYSFINRVSDIPNDADVIIIFGGTNDYLLQGEYGEFGDTKTPNTYCYDFKLLIDKINEENKDAEIFLVTTYKNDKELYYTNDEKHEKTFEEYMNFQFALAENYENVNVIDFYNTGILNTTISEVNKDFTSDGFLINDKGSKIIGDHIVANLMIYLSK